MKKCETPAAAGGSERKQDRLTLRIPRPAPAIYCAFSEAFPRFPKVPRAPILRRAAFHFMENLQIAETFRPANSTKRRGSARRRNFLRKF
ncbi:MAG: hypothetical protein BHW65_08895 [Verrucomicrobia bacterium CAG:312_58_20]|nr:MAG: hypothetical protein BHW65_08895 [Verrucomicrobia bacterium CAG:312_58_20]